MKNLKFIAILIIFLLTGCSSTLKNEQTAEADNQATLEKSCRTEKNLGSKLTSKKCKTAREWAEYDKRKDLEMRNASRRTSSGQYSSRSREK